MGKEFHWVHVLDASGRELLSRKLESDEADISKLIDKALSDKALSDKALSDKALSLAEEVLWAVDQPGGSAALLLALLYGNETRGFFTSLASP